MVIVIIISVIIISIVIYIIYKRGTSYSQRSYIFFDIFTKLATGKQVSLSSTLAETLDNYGKIRGWDAKFRANIDYVLERNVHLSGESLDFLHKACYEIITFEEIQKNKHKGVRYFESNEWKSEEDKINNIIHEQFLAIVLNQYLKNKKKQN